MTKKKKKILITVIIIITLLLIGISIYFILNSNKFENNSTNTNDNYKDKINDSVSYEITTLDFNECNFENENTCTKNYKYNNISIEKYTNEGLDLYRLKINNKNVIDNIYNISLEIDIMDDILLFTTSAKNARTTSIYGFDLKGNQILNIHNVDENNPTMVIKDDKKPIYTIENSNIIFDGSRMTLASFLVTEIDDNKNEKTVSICDDKDKYKDQVVEGKYTIEYLGNHEFSEIRNLNYTLLKETTYFDLCK